jgi:hypothetical protein
VCANISSFSFFYHHRIGFKKELLCLSKTAVQMLDFRHLMHQTASVQREGDENRNVDKI